MAEHHPPAEPALRPGERMVAGKVWVFDADLLNSYLRHISGERRNRQFERGGVYAPSALALTSNIEAAANPAGAA